MPNAASESPPSGGARGAVPRRSGVGRAAVLAGVLAVLALPAPAQAGVPRDRIVLSGAVDVRRGESVHDVVIVDGPVTVAGRVRSDLVALHGRVTVSGRVHGDVVALSSNAVRLRRGARIGGDLVYRGRRPTVPAGVTVAGDVRKLNVGKAAAPFSLGVAAAVWLAVSVSSLVLGLLLLWLAPRAANAALATARARVGPAIAWGFALLIGVPVVALVALVTLVGIPFGIGLLLALFPLYALGYTASAWLLGRSLVRPPRGRLLAFLAGWAILRILAIVPVLGGLIWLAATVFGMGALAVAAWRARAPLGPAAAAEA
jgi:cytoskeletal protein CcmA (bactofilin family)